jgi:hypothetical protein
VLAIAGFFDKRGDSERALEYYDDVIQVAGSDAMALRALLRKAEVLRLARRYHAARDSLGAARSHPACGGAWADAVRRALAELEVHAAGPGERRVQPGPGV